MVWIVKLIFLNANSFFSELLSVNVYLDPLFFNLCLT